MTKEELKEVVKQAIVEALSEYEESKKRTQVSVLIDDVEDLGAIEINSNH